MHARASKCAGQATGTNHTPVAVVVIQEREQQESVLVLLGAKVAVVSLEKASKFGRLHTPLEEKPLQLLS